MITPDNLIGKNIDQFRINELLGQGAMGVVYKAFDNVLQRTVALKLIPKSPAPHTSSMFAARKRLIQEAQAAGRLSHPNIVTIFSYGETDEFQYICMENIVGKTLAEILTEQKILPVEEAIDIIEQILLALDKAHEEQIVHRDIKPTNIMILPDKRAKVMDFGIAKLPSLNLTTTGTVLGTPYYMSPEQITGQKVGIQSDIFSVGALCYQILTGVRPFEGDTTVAVAYKIVEVEPVPLSHLKTTIPLEVENICKKALIKDPSLRYQTPIQMLADIRAYKEKGTRTQKQTTDATIKSKVSLLSPKSTEEKKEENPKFSTERIETKQDEVDKTKPEPFPPTPLQAIEIPETSKPDPLEASPVSKKGGGTALKTVTITIGLLMVVVGGIFLVVRNLKPGVQSDRTPPAVVQPLSPLRKSNPQLDSLFLQAKDQIQSNPANARRLLDQILSLDPNNFEANFQMARLLTFQRDYQKAIPLYQKARQLNNRIPEIPFNLGYIYMNQGDYDQAIKYYEVTRTISPPFQDEVLTNLGVCYLKKNNIQQAQGFFREALKVNPQNTKAQNLLKSIGG
jgi:serine/threonine protein kinase